MAKTISDSHICTHGAGAYCKICHGIGAAPAPLPDAELIAELERHIEFNFTTDCREEIVQVVDRFKALREQCERQRALLSRTLPDLQWADDIAYGEFNAVLKDQEIIADIEACLSGSAGSEQG